MVNAQHFGTIGRRHQLKDFGLPELALVGRSNCGKSTLLNTLLGQKKLARTSARPGRTQLIHLYRYQVQQQAVLLADLPGYGYTKTSARTTKQWPALLAAYLDRPQVRCFMCLLDIRRTFRDEEWRLMHHLQRQQISYFVVLTKADKLNKNQEVTALQQHEASLVAQGLYPQKTFKVAATKRIGLEPLRTAILEQGLAVSV